MYKIYCDAGKWRNRICVYDPARGEKILKIMKGELTNNELEYLALHKAIKYSVEVYRGERVQIFSDSKLAVNQTNGKWKCVNTNLFYLMYKCRDRLVPDTTIHWVPRDKNPAGQILEDLYISEKSVKKRFM